MPHDKGRRDKPESRTADGRTKFAGYYRDGVGQDYANARYYSATAGSFWSPDPSGILGATGASLSWNRFAYAGGDPINNSDPTGLCTIGGVEYPDPCYGVTGTGNSGNGGGGGGDGGGAPLPAESGDPGSSGTNDYSNGNGYEGSNWQLLDSIKKTLDSALSHSDCAAAFGKAGIWSNIQGYGGVTAEQVLDSLIAGNSKYGSINFVDPTDPTNGLTPLQNNALGGNPAITVPSKGPWSIFNGPSTIDISTLDIGQNFNTSALAAEEIILHELGHLTFNLGWSSQIKPDAFNPGQSSRNDDTITKDCGSYLK